MDPFLAQGFSNLTKALIGDPETDYQVARTNRVNTLLPLLNIFKKPNCAGVRFSKTPRPIDARCLAACWAAASRARASRR